MNKLELEKLGITDFNKKYNIDEWLKEMLFFVHSSNNGNLANGSKRFGNNLKYSTFALHKSQKIIKKLIILIINELTFSKWKKLVLKKLTRRYF